jgi:hypothetical protein
MQRGIQEIKECQTLPLLKEDRQANSSSIPQVAQELRETYIPFDFFPTPHH